MCALRQFVEPTHTGLRPAAARAQQIPTHGDDAAPPAIAALVVVAEILAIAYIQWRYMDTPPVSAAAKVMLGGGPVLATGVLIGSS